MTLKNGDLGLKVNENSMVYILLLTKMSSVFFFWGGEGGGDSFY